MGGRLRYLLLGLIIGASGVVLLTSNSPSFSTVNAMGHATPISSSLPGAIASAVLPNSVTALGGDIPETDVSHLPKAAPDGSARAKGAAAKTAKAKKADGDDKKKAPGAPAAEGDSLEMPPGLQEVLDGMGGFGSALKDN